MNVTFLVKGEAKSMFVWPAVPRVGETVDLAVVNPSVPKLHVVTDVVWRNLGGELRADVHCEPKGGKDG